MSSKCADLLPLRTQYVKAVIEKIAERFHSKLIIKQVKAWTHLSLSTALINSHEMKMSTGTEDA
jgi:hypothetical protein